MKIKLNAPDTVKLLALNSSIVCLLMFFTDVSYAQPDGGVLGPRVNYRIECPPGHFSQCLGINCYQDPDLPALGCVFSLEEKTALSGGFVTSCEFVCPPEVCEPADPDFPTYRFVHIIGMDADPTSTDEDLVVEGFDEANPEVVVSNVTFFGQINEYPATAIDNGDGSGTISESDLVADPRFNGFDFSAFPVPRNRRLYVFEAHIPLDDLPGSSITGDVNRDGVVNLLDVGPFVDLIASGNFQQEADINGDAQVNLLDVGPFVELLVGGQARLGLDYQKLVYAKGDIENVSFCQTYWENNHQLLNREEFRDSERD